MKTYSLILAFLILFTGFTAADGIIIIHPPHPGPVISGPPAYIPLSVKTHKVSISIEDNIAVTGVDEEFYNPNNTQLEGTYIFPLPENAVISRFSLFINGVETKGEILDKDKARDIYEGIVRKMRDPALLEYVGRKMFKARVFPIPANGTRRVKLEYTETLNADAGLYSYTYPLNTEKFSSQPLQEVLIDVNIKGNKPLKNIFCPTHKTDMKRVSESETRLTYEAQNVLPDKDFTLFYTMEGGKFGLSLASFQKKGKDGYFIAMLAPEFADSGTILAKDVAFVFDTSGSMNGKKIEQARGALKFCLNSLKPEDRFSIVSFSTEARAFRKNLVKADKAVIEEAVEFVGNLEARGGTNISEALETALKMKTDDDRPFMVVFMTDGKPTLGIQGESELIDAVKKYNTSGARIFVFGVGFNLNTFILDRFAEDSRGARTYVTPEEDIEIKVSNFFTKVESPVLTDVSVDFENIEIYDMYPRKLPDLFRGTQIEILGRYKGAGERAVILKGKVNGSEKKYVFEEDFSGKTAAGENIPKLWAMRKIYYLLDEIRLHGMKQELKDEVVLLSKEFGIMTPYTSFLVLEDNETVAVNRPQRSADGAIRRLRKEALAPHAIEEAEKADRAVRGGGFSGRDAVTATQELKAAKEKGAAADADDANVFRGKKGGKVIKSVGNKTFYYDGTVWIESTFKDETTRKIVWMSDEYFTFLKDYPDCGKYLSLGKAVVFENGGTWIEIVEK